MSDLLVLCAFISFVFFLGLDEYPYAAISGWSCIVLNLWSELPAYFGEQNFLYPCLALLSVPFIVITVRLLVHRDEIVLQLSRAAAFAVIIYTPFTLVPPLHDGLVSIVITLAFSIITALGHHPVLYAWDMMGENGFYNQIVLACTGIPAIAIMLGVAFSERRISGRQALSAFLIIVLPIFFLNLLRVVVIFIAISDRWFARFPDPTGTGDANFFWSHNVIAEGLAIVFLLILIQVLARSIPHLGTFARGLVSIYLGWIPWPAEPVRDML